MHEASLHEDNSFITLTYDRDHLPQGGTLIKKHYQDFMKRTRKRHTGRNIKYFHCGEYGDENRRPHYHAILFGLAFPDQVFYKTSKDGSLLYQSEELQKLWPFGFSTVGEVTFESAAYVARYAMKKLTFYGEDAYEHIDLDTGEVTRLQHEYTTRSLKPAIGKLWLKEFKDEVYSSDSVTMRGREMKPPKYYDRCLEVQDIDAYTAIKEARKKQALLHGQDSTTRRLRDREIVKLAQISTLTRTLDDSADHGGI